MDVLESIPTLIDEDLDLESLFAGETYYYNPVPAQIVHTTPSQPLVQLQLGCMMLGCTDRLTCKQRLDVGTKVERIDGGACSRQDFWR